MVEKHECFHCDMRTEKIQVGNESIELLVPSFAVRFEVVETQKSPKLHTGLSQVSLHRPKIAL